MEVMFGTREHTARCNVFVPSTNPQVGCLELAVAVFIFLPRLFSPHGFVIRL